MSLQKANLENIASAATALSQADANMNEAFEALRKAGAAMENGWNSRAGSAAIPTMHKLFQGNEMRSLSMQNYCRILQQVVVPGYTVTEVGNTKLSDNFNRG